MLKANALAQVRAFIHIRYRSKLGEVLSFAQGCGIINPNHKQFSPTQVIAGLQVSELYALLWIIAGGVIMKGFDWVSHQIEDSQGCCKSKKEKAVGQDQEIGRVGQNQHGIQISLKDQEAERVSFHPNFSRTSNLIDIII